MGRNLTNLPISASFQYLAQVSGSENDVTDGLGVDIDSLNVDITGTATTASYVAAANVDGTVASASFATTASYAENAGASTLQEVLDNSNEASADIVLTGSYQRVSGSFSGSAIDNITDTYTGTDKIQHVITLTQAEYDALTPAANTFYVITDADATMTTGSVSDATLTFTKDDGTTFDLVVDNVDNATSASHAVQADSASIADDLISTANINITSITASNASFTSASIGYLQTITGSAKIIGDAFIILNNDTPTERYAGLVVQDSGSTANTASLLFDGQTNDWFYQYTDDGGVTDEFGVVMFGPGYNTQGAHVYPADNAILKGTGDHHIVTSSMVDDGTLVTINSNVSASGYISASEFIGDGSGLTGVGAFPFTGSAEISGSLKVDGNVVFGLPGNTATGLGAAALGGGNAGGNTVSGQNTVALGGFGNTVSQDQSIISGRQNDITGGSIHTILGGLLNDITSTEGTCAIVSGKQATISGTSENSAIIGGVGQTINSHNQSVILGGNTLSTSKDEEVVVPNLSIYGDTVATGSAEISGSLKISNPSGFSIVTGHPDNIATGARSAVIGGGASGGADANEATGIESTVVGGHNNVSSNEYTFIGGGKDNTASAAYSATVAGRNHSATGQYAVLIGGAFNSATAQSSGVFVGQSNTVTGTYSAIVGGLSHTNNGPYSVILGGSGHSIATGGHDRNGMLAGQSNTITSGNASATVGGFTNDINASTAAVVAGRNNSADHQDSVVIGGDGLSTTKAQEVVVPNLLVKGNVVQDVNTITVTSNTGSLDASLGSLFEITLGNGVDTQLEIENQVAGQTLQLKITNNATAAGTISFDSQFQFEGGTAFEATAATSAVDILTLTTFDGTSVQCVGAKNFS